MITTCAGCHQKYRLDAAKVPVRLINVRCPECQTVFLLDGRKRDDEAESPVNPAPAADVEQYTDPAAAEAVAPPQAVEAEPAPQVAVPSAPPAPPVTVDAPAATTSASASPAVATVEEAPPAAQTGTRPRRRRSRDKTEMLARALVSDILVYNQSVRDKALEDGNLLEILGPEIKKSWELYKEKVTPEVANSTTHFRDALNDILANGEKVF